MPLNQSIRIAVRKEVRLSFHTRLRKMPRRTGHPPRRHASLDYFVEPPLDFEVPLRKWKSLQGTGDTGDLEAATGNLRRKPPAPAKLRRRRTLEDVVSPDDDALGFEIPVRRWTSLRGPERIRRSRGGGKPQVDLEVPNDAIAITRRTWSRRLGWSCYMGITSCRFALNCP